MRLLLDTHIFLWFLNADPKLPALIRDAVVDPSNEVTLSVVSVWEAVIKHALGKLQFVTPPAEYLSVQRDLHGITSLALDEASMPHLANLPPHHRDPFDRILVAQALQQGMTLVTLDPAVLAYPVPTLGTP